MGTINIHWKQNPTVADYKEVKTDQILTKTKLLEKAGVEHPSDSNIVFSLSLENQSIWNTLRAELIDEAVPDSQFPIEVGTIDNDDYIINDYAEFKSIYKAAKNRKSYIIKEERKLLKLIKNATTKTAVQNITDSRV